MIALDDDLKSELEFLQSLDGEEFNNAVDNHWTRATPLFAFVGSRYRCTNTKHCGCLTLIRGNPTQYAAITPNGTVDRELTKMIIEDLRLPDHLLAIKKKHLPIFAEWQMRIRARFALTT